MVAGVLLLIPTAGSCMAGKFVLFSAVTGVVLDHGKPVPGAAIMRTWNWAWKESGGSDTTYTDAGGRFSLPEVTGSSFFGRFMPHEPYVTQGIVIKHGGHEYVAWRTVKRNYEPDGELGRPAHLTCRLEAEPVRGGKVFGISTLEP